MRENMIYNPGVYQLREVALKRMLDISEQRKHSQSKGIVFYGDSITEFCQLDHFYQSKKPLYNCGIAGATTDELLWMVDEAVIQYHPSKVFLMVGINDLGNTVMHSPRKIAQHMNMLAHMITKNCPGAQLYIISTLPCVEEQQDYHHVLGIRCNEFVKMIYQCLKELVTSQNTTIIDVYSLFVDGDRVKKDFYLDGLHLNEKGYEVLSQQLQCYL